MERYHQIVCILILTLFCQRISAQEAEYKMELGGMAGLGFYLGDANMTWYNGSSMAGGAMARYNINPRMSIKANLVAGKIVGDASNNKNKFPDLAESKLKFSNTLVDLSGQYEISFWGYGTGTGYKGTKRLTPYIQVGLGFTYCNVLTMNLPIGVGVKYKVTDRLNVGLDWTMRFAMSDKLDGISDPYHIKSGFMKNKDSYSYTMLYVSYDLFQKLRKCNND